MKPSRQQPVGVAGPPSFLEDLASGCSLLRTPTHLTVLSWVPAVRGRFSGSFGAITSASATGHGERIHLLCRLAYDGEQVNGGAMVVHRPGGIEQEPACHRGTASRDRKAASKDRDHRPHVALGGKQGAATQRGARSERDGRL